ncbi:MAG: hypothetical protein HYU86_03310, partial [Chloroflexi bacterium]|nr:hypothetical protein [Chloroflexota bacterium]
MNSNIGFAKLATSPRWRFLGAGLIALVVLLTALLFFLTGAFAIHDLGLLELDRNAITDHAGAGLPDDWDRVFNGTANTTVATFITDGGTVTISGVTVTGTQFHGGGSKDDLDISPSGSTAQHWLWNDGEPLDKDDILHAFAAAYANPTDTGNNNVGDLIIYFGLDRFSNSGSAQVGFWFLQTAVDLTTTPDSGGFDFSGVHAVGDVLVQSNFSNGGVIDSIAVFKWVGSGGDHGTLQTVFSAADCVGPPPMGGDDPACASVNKGPTASPWPFTEKASDGGVTPNTFGQGTFFEGGINITRLVPELSCTHTFLAETRSSTPFDSRLKDFALGSFNICDISVDKTGPAISKIGDGATYTITIANTGQKTVYKDTIDDSLMGSFALGGVNQANPYIVSNSCGASLAVGTSCTIIASRVVQAGDPDPLINTVNVIYRGKADLSGTAVSASDSHSVNLFQPSIAVSKSGDNLSKAGDVVNYTIIITNTSSDDSPNLVKDSIVDSLLGSLSGCDSLAPGDSCTINVAYTVKEGDPDPLVNTVTVHYHPLGFPNDITASASHSTDLVHPKLAISKTGDELSKIGDDVNYTIIITNTGDTSLDRHSVVDSLMGDISGDFPASLAPGDSATVNKTRTVLGGDPDPLVNTVTADYDVPILGNHIVASASHSVNLFQPSIAVSKSGDNLSKAGDVVNYTIIITNTSSDDSPN